ncbi:MAG: urease accessory protein UreF [Gammaproteobacteria bacterium]|nr:urease accessory protein UreF [Gammaproteobacteria bacterium]
MLARTRLLQMTSQAFPIGGYSHSFGLEAAIENGLVRDESAVGQWIADVLSFTMGRYELPVLREMRGLWIARDPLALNRLNEQFLATRESAELRGATVQMGFSMRALLAVLPALPGFLLETLQSMHEPSLPCVWSGAAQAWGIAASDSAAAYLWSFAENQVLVAMKSVPIGQSSGQRVLLKVGEQIAVLAACSSPTNQNRSNFAPGLAILCSQHETQYSRLFRS